jgi:hypothetical protein
VRKPPRWEAAKVGDPVATLHSYTNWVQGVKFSVFSEERGETKYDSSVPQYPQKIYDYHYLDRVLPVGKVAVVDLKEWNKDLSNILRTLGPKKQANVIIMFTDLPRDFYYSIMKIWKHGKKNDVIVIIGLESSGEINWVEVASWSKKDIFNVKLRDEITELKTIDREKIIKTIHDVTMSDFQRRPMKEFEYLKKEIQIATGIWIILTILVIGCWIGIDIGIAKNTFTNTFRTRRRFR